MTLGLRERDIAIDAHIKVITENFAADRCLIKIAAEISFTTIKPAVRTEYDVALQDLSITDPEIAFGIIVIVRHEAHVTISH